MYVWDAKANKLEPQSDWLKKGSQGYK
jgi:hypothetical protein